MAVYKLNKHI